MLVGPNNAGKSSVLQLLAVLKQSLGKAELQLDGDLVQLGDANDVLAQEASHDGKSRTVLVEGRLPRESWSSTTPEASICPITYHCRFNPRGGLIDHVATLQHPGEDLELRNRGWETEPAAISLSRYGQNLQVPLKSYIQIGQAISYESPPAKRPDPPEQRMWLAESYGRPGLRHFCRRVCIPTFLRNFSPSFPISAACCRGTTIRLPLQAWITADELAGD